MRAKNMNVKGLKSEKRRGWQRGIKGCLLFAFLASVMFLYGCGSQEDVSFARRTFEALIQGRYSARYAIDWTSFVAFETNIGLDYSKASNDQDRMDYQRAFIDSFKQAFREGRGNAKAFYNWRIYNDKDPQIKIIAANAADKGRVLLFAVKYENGRRKLIEIKALQLTDQEKFYQYEQEQSRELPALNKR